MNIVHCPDVVLSAELGDIIICNVSKKIDFKVTYKNEVILSETYFPDNAGFIYIRDIALLADMYLREIRLSPESSVSEGTVTFRLQLKEGTEEIIRDITIYACSAETGGTMIVDDLKLIPLTRCHKKTVCCDQKEYISFYEPGDIMLKIVYTGTTQDLSFEFPLAKLTGNQDTIHRLDVSPDRIAEISGIDSSRIVKYSVYKIEKLAAEFTVNKHLRPQKTFVFFNTFGAWETFTCTGDEETGLKWERTYGRFNRRQQLISGQPEAINTINTGYLTREQIGLLEDLLNSGQIALIDEHGWHPITIAEETFKVISKWDELINIEFKYRLAGDNHMQYRYKWNDYKIFDYTFDETFN